MVLISLEKFTSSTKRINKYIQNITPDKFDLSPPKKLKEINYLRDEATLNENKELLLQRLKLNNTDDDFISKLVLFSTANKNILPTDKMLKQQMKRFKKKGEK